MQWADSSVTLLRCTCATHMPQSESPSGAWSATDGALARSPTPAPAPAHTSKVGGSMGVYEAVAVTELLRDSVLRVSVGTAVAVAVSPAVAVPVTGNRRVSDSVSETVAVAVQTRLDQVIDACRVPVPLGLAVGSAEAVPVGVGVTESTVVGVGVSRREGVGVCVKSGEAVGVREGGLRECVGLRVGGEAVTGTHGVGVKVGEGGGGDGDLEGLGVKLSERSKVRVGDSVWLAEGEGV